MVDQYRDPALAVLVRLVEGRPKLAAAVGDVDILPEEADKLPSTAFAWPEKRAFPLHTKEHAMLSRVYRENSPNVPAFVDVAIKEACDLYGVDDTLFTRVKQAAPVDDPEDYLLPDRKLIPVRSAEQVKTAEAKVIAGYTKLSVESRATACTRLVEKAAHFGVTLNPLTHKLAGFTVTSTKVLKDWLGARVEAAPPQYKEAFQKLATAVSELPAEIRDRDTQVKLATVIDELDKKAGLVKYYDRKLPDPLLSVFNTAKIAGHGVNLGSKFVPMDRLASYPSTFFGDIIGDDLVREASDGRGGMDVHKLAVILETLPMDMKNVLALQMR
jgi:hypothetical protein